VTIANGSAIVKADLDAMTNTALALIRADNAQLPLAYPFTFHFRALRAGGAPTPEYARRARFVAPRDLWLEAISLGVWNMGGTTTATLQQTGSGDALAFMPASVSVAGAGAASLAHATRTLYDNTRGNPRSSALAANPVFRAIPKGTPMTLQLETTNTTTPEHCWVTLICRGGFARP
jgi:hypothetical protein